MHTLKAVNLVKKIKSLEIVKGMSLEVSSGEVVGLLGPNGAGKTTTFYMTIGLIKPDGGHVFLNDEDITGDPMFKRARKGIGYLPQETSIFRKLTVEENVMAILETFRMSKAQQEEIADSLLEELGIKHLADQKASVLSGGERRRLEITGHWQRIRRLFCSTNRLPVSTLWRLSILKTLSVI